MISKLCIYIPLCVNHVIQHFKFSVEQQIQSIQHLYKFELDQPMVSEEILQEDRMVLDEKTSYEGKN